jgi:MYXO-CTERM domain-containing protein
MMTQLLLALYPEIYKAGSSFAGVPAGCSNAFDAQGLCGLGTQTAQQWGDRVRAMDPGYSGHRPRVQLVQGTADATINFENFNEGIKEWTNVLGLSTSPTSTTTGLTLGTHAATRQAWQDSCGYVVLDALTSIGGDHGPSDALFAAQYVVPFLGLDQPGPVDPEIARCGTPAGDGGPDGAVDGSTGNRDSGSGGSSGSTATSSASGGATSAGTKTSASGSSSAAAGSSANNGTAGGQASNSSTSAASSAASGSGTAGCGCSLVGIDSAPNASLSAIAAVLLAARRRRRGRERARTGRPAGPGVP